MPDKKAGPISFIGCGCGALGGLVLLLGALALIGIPMGVYNYSVTTQAGIGGGAAACVGVVGVIIGVALWMLGKKPVE